MRTLLRSVSVVSLTLAMACASGPPEDAEFGQVPSAEELYAEGLAFPTAREIAIPDGPAARVNRWGARAGVQVSFVFDESTNVEDQNPRPETSEK